jgi:hypothetical protein
MIALWKQYQAVKPDVSNSTSLENTRNDLNTAIDKSNNLYKKDAATGAETGLVMSCAKERKIKGWAIPGGPTSSLGTTQGSASGTAVPLANSEKALFCDAPIIGGYTHGTPIGSNHDSVFTGPDTTKPELPMVNAKNVFTYKSITIKSILGGAFTGSPSKTAHVSIVLSCNTIFTAKILDYKGNLPGSTNPLLLTSQKELPDDTGLANSGTCTYPPDPTIAGSTPEVDEGVTKEDCALNNGSWTAPPAPISTTPPPGGTQ